ncbi:hypothetical protein [Cryobacterium sp. MDB2-33-2]|uniref:hypothetical protein n=1 Tax=Cryobacterium sp. MDB2-33-2 TaxID=1259179 RepID=UPI00106D2F23|nr:hypothetical protein [Cryobacterium sp. MDB2-33-2]TFC11897.1 hypothetical protein E3O59_00060 [Cryobacterium sp. MDB2-33-2]
MDSSLIEALALGAICTVGVLVVPWLGAGAGHESSDVIALLFVAGTITPYFLFARAQGILQGAGDPRSVIWWSTGAQIAQLLLSIAVLLCGFGALGILSVLLVTAVIGAVGSSIQARRSSVRLSGRPFTVESSVVLLLTITFAWLTNMDVVLVRAGSPENIAGAYAAAAVLIKTTLIVPATLSLYLLPRFVSRKKDASMTKYGVNVTLAITFLSGVAMFIIVSLAGGLIVPVFGPGYQSSLQLLPWLALAWLPWAMAQGLLIRLTASSSKLALVALVVVAIAQWIGSTALLPDVLAMIALNGILGFAALVVLFLVHLRSSKIDGRGVES